MNWHPPIISILTLSIIIQAAAAIMAFRLIGITGRRAAWGLIAMALALMAVRRMVPLYRLITGDVSISPDPLNEIIGLALSIVMASGIACIAPLFIERKKREDALAERVVLAELSADIGFSMAKQDDLQSILKACAAALVRRLDVAFARIWTLNTAENVLEMQASAGMYTRIDGSHSRIPVGKFKIGRIAEERKPHITNAVIGDPRVHDQEWAKSEGMVAFAGHPLTIGDQLVGVMAMFSRHPLTDVTLMALAAVSNEIAVGIERKRSENALHESTAFQNSLLNAIPIPVFHKDREGRYRGFNKAYETFFGATKDQLIGKTVFDISPPELAEIYHAKDTELLESGGIQQYESQVKNTQGIVRDVIFNKAVFADSQGVTGGLIGAILDITERKLAEEKLHRLNRELRAISSCNQTLMRAEDEQSLLADICRIVCDEAGYRMAWVGYAENDDARTIRPLAWAGVEGGYLEEAKPTWADTEQGRAPSGTAIRSGECVCLQDFTIVPKAASWRDSAVQRGYRSSIALPLKDERGNVFGVFNIYSVEPNAFSTDEIRLLHELAGDLAFGIMVLRARTEHTRMEQVRLAHLQFVENMDQVNRAIQGTNDLEKMLSDVLDAVLEIFDCDRAWLLYPCDPEAAFWSVPMERTKPEYPGAGVQGQEIPMDPEVQRMFRIQRGTDRPVSWGPGSDCLYPEWLTEKFGVQSQLSVSTYPKTGKPWQFGMHQCSHARVWQPAEQRLFQEINRRLADSLSSLLAYRDLQESETKYRRIVDTASEGIWMLGPDTMTTFVNARMADLLGYSVEEMLGRPVTDFMFEEDAADHLSKMDNRRQGISEHYERRFRHKDGQTVWALASATPILDDEQHCQGSFSMFTNITERKELEKRLIQSQKLEAIGTLAGGIAHDFNNILTPILGYAEMAQLDLTPGHPTMAKLTEVIKAGLRAKDLVKQILTFSRQKEHQLLPLSLYIIVKEALKLLRSAIPTSIEILQDIDPDSGMVLADGTQLHQIIINLCTNAYYAMRETGGVLAVSLHSRQIESDDPKVNGLSLTTGAYVVLEVSDTGCGIDQPTLSKIFDPYFTTKKQGEGTGLGLSVVHGIVKEYGGYISVYSEPGKGSTFRVYLPRIVATQVVEQPANALPLPQGTEKILVVDDDPDIVGLNTIILEALGYHVTGVTGSKEALRMFQGAPRNFDLVFTDMTMPDMTGADLGLRIHAIRPDLPIILCTGFSELIDGEKARDTGIQSFLIKPVQRRELAETVRRVLDEAKMAAKS